MGGGGGGGKEEGSCGLGIDIFAQTRSTDQSFSSDLISVETLHTNKNKNNITKISLKIKGLFFNQNATCSLINIL